MQKIHKTQLLTPGKLYIITNMEHIIDYCNSFQMIALIQQHGNKPILLLEDNIEYTNRIFTQIQCISTVFLINNIEVQFESHIMHDNFQNSYTRQKFLDSLQQVQ